MKALRLDQPNFGSINITRSSDTTHLTIRQSSDFIIIERNVLSKLIKQLQAMLRNIVTEEAVAQSRNENTNGINDLLRQSSRQGS